MNGFTFLAPHLLAWLLLVPVGIMLLSWARVRQRQALLAFARSSSATAHMAQGYAQRLWWRGILLLIAVGALVIALADPAWNPHQQPIAQESRDVIFVLDVSRSMLARDCQPSRLAVAKSAIDGCLDSLVSDRVGLVVFAGSAAIRCPLTQDKDFFRKMLQEVSPDSVAQGGTRIGDALQKVHDKLSSPNQLAIQDVILLSDGGDMDSRPTEVVKGLNEKQSHLLVLGLGDHRYGERIPLSDDVSPNYLIYKGVEVWTKLNGQGLQEIAKACDHGIYYHIGTAPCDLAGIYRHVRDLAPSEERDIGHHLAYDHGAWYALALAALSVTAALLTLVRPPGQRRPLSQRMATVLLCTLLLPSHLMSEDTPAKIPSLNSCMTLLQEKKWAEADKAFTAYLEQHDESFLAHYHLAYCTYLNKNYAKATIHFSRAQSLASNQRDLLDSTYNLGNSLVQQAAVIAASSPDASEDEDEEEVDVEVERLRQLREAVWCYRQVLAHDQQYHHAAINLEKNLRLLHKNAEEQKAAQHNPDSQPAQQQQNKDPSKQLPEDDNQSDQEFDKKNQATLDKKLDQQDQQASSARSVQFDNLTLSPPTATPSDILKEEQMNSLQRTKGKGTQAKVDKDW
jgi:Ca-activated chloride channel homolog